MIQLRSLILFAVIMVSLIRANEETITFNKFGTVTLYYSPGKTSQVVLFISGDGGWNLGVVDMARSLVSLDVLVAGIDIIHYLKQLGSSNEKCSYPAQDFEALSKYIQKKMNFPSYHQPIIVGYSSGATLAYALIVQAPQGTFAGAMSMGFCPDLPLIKPFCHGSGLTFEPGPKGKGYNFLPADKLATPWIAVKGQVDQVCDPAFVDTFVKKVPGAEVVSLPKVGHGFSVEKNWMPQFKEAFNRLIKQHAQGNPQAEVSADVSGLPLVEVPVNGAQKDFFAVMISGDGGWAGIDKEVSASIAQSGVPVVGLNSLQYFWTARTPEVCAADLDRIINHYRIAWKKESVVVIGYSLGADVLPFMASRLPQATLDKIKLLAFLGLSPTADFQFHLTDWIGGSPGKTAKPVLPEIEKLKGRKMVCFYGTEDKESLGDEIDQKIVKAIPLEGGHHFGGHYDIIAQTILREVAGQ
jgi:type IV secretory pathway VirJ component